MSSKPFIASAEDFNAKQKDYSCDGKNSSLLQSFPYPKLENFNRTVIQRQCESYCGRHVDCWGCTLICTSKDTRSCTWTAVTSCENGRDSGNLIDVGTTQKPGQNDIYGYLC